MYGLILKECNHKKVKASIIIDVLSLWMLNVHLYKKKIILSSLKFVLLNELKSLYQLDLYKNSTTCLGVFKPTN